MDPHQLVVKLLADGSLLEAPWAPTTAWPIHHGEGDVCIDTRWWFHWSQHIRSGILGLPSFTFHVTDIANHKIIWQFHLSPFYVRQGVQVYHAISPSAEVSFATVAASTSTSSTSTATQWRLGRLPIWPHLFSSTTGQIPGPGWANTNKIRLKLLRYSQEWNGLVLGACHTHIKCA